MSTTTVTTSTLAALATEAFRVLTDSAEEMSDELFLQECAQLTSAADTLARTRLGAPAADLLTWRVTGTMHLPPDTLETTAFVDGGPDYLRYRVHPEAETFEFELVQPCGACRQAQVAEVRDLAALGGLLVLAVDLKAGVGDDD